MDGTHDHIDWWLWQLLCWPFTCYDYGRWMEIIIISDQRLWKSGVEPFYEQRIGFWMTIAACSESFQQLSVISHQLGKEDKYTSSLQAFYVTVHINEWTWIIKCWLSSLVKTKIILARETTTVQAHVGIKGLQLTPVMTMVQSKGCTTDTKDHQGGRKRINSRQHGNHGMR